MNHLDKGLKGKISPVPFQGLVKRRKSLFNDIPEEQMRFNIDLLMRNQALLQAEII